MPASSRDAAVVNEVALGFVNSMLPYLINPKILPSLQLAGAL